MKYQTTQKAIRANYTVIRVPYCALQTVLNYRNAEAYTVHREGWGADIYNIGGGYAIATGYAPFGGVKLPYDYLQGLEKKALQIMQNASDPRAELEILKIGAHFVRFAKSY